MKNSLSDLNSILFEELERLNDDEIMEDSDKASKEIRRAKAMEGIGEKITEVARTQLAAISTFKEYQMQDSEIPELLISKKPVLRIGADK